jgi:hypothetical protein
MCAFLERLESRLLLQSLVERQTRPLVREDARTGQDRNCQTVNTSGHGARHQDILTDRPTVSHKVTRSRSTWCASHSCQSGFQKCVFLFMVVREIFYSPERRGLLLPNSSARRSCFFALDFHIVCSKYTHAIRTNE